MIFIKERIIYINLKKISFTKTLIYILFGRKNYEFCKKE